MAPKEEWKSKISGAWEQYHWKCFPSLNRHIHTSRRSQILVANRCICWI